MPPKPLEPGDPSRLGRFELLARLGEGGQGVVYLGRGTTPGGEKVAVKVLRSSVGALVLQRLARELDAVHKVQPFVTARVIEASAEGDRRYVVSEFIDGPSLQERVDALGPLPEGELHRLAVGTAAALTAIHGAGVVHRDFKPANVLLGRDGPRVVDFGIARVIDYDSITSGIVGTPAYMSPEQLAGQRPTSAVDMFAWAGTVIFAATGRPAFAADSIPAAMHRVLYGEPDLGAVPPALLPVVEQCLDKDPDRRPTARDVLLHLLDPTMRSSGVTSAAPTFGAAGRPAHGGPPDGQGTTGHVAEPAWMANATDRSEQSWPINEDPGDTDGTTAGSAHIGVRPTAARRGTRRRRGRRNARRLWLACAGVVVVAAAAVTGILKFGARSDDAPVHAFATPARIGTYVRAADLEHQASLTALRDEITRTSAGHASDVVSAVYESGNSAAGATTQVIMFIGGHLANADPTASIASFTRNFPAAHMVSAGSLGGEAACAEEQSGTSDPVSLCAWFDDDSFGELVSPTMNASELGLEMLTVRPAVELVVRK